MSRVKRSIHENSISIAKTRPDRNLSDCLITLRHSVNIVKAFIMRLIFSLHSFTAICLAYSINRELWCLVNVVGVVILIIELFVTIVKRKGKEPTWFFPSFFIYICTMIPPIWFIELFRIDAAQRVRRNLTDGAYVDMFSGLNDLGLEPLNVNNMTQALPISFTHETAAVGLEISLMLLVILGRWFLPKGDISRSTLSQLLLVYMSLASDIVDLLSLLNEDEIQQSKLMIYFTLAIFSWSLFQFCLNLVVTRGRNFQATVVEDDKDDGEEGEEKIESIKIDLKPKLNDCADVGQCIKNGLLDSEVWSILVTLIFQDGPFLALRLTAVIRFNVRTFVTMFFTCKNAIILFLQIYRLSAIFSEDDEDDSHLKILLEQLNATAAFSDTNASLSVQQQKQQQESSNSHSATKEVPC